MIPGSLAIVFVLTFAARHHVVRADGGVLVLPKQHPSLHDTFVDVRQWTDRDWQQHAELLESTFAARDADVAVFIAEEGSEAILSE
ncbi:MAG: hypothetical protein R3C49_18210 [Planctomycetaceae bacterium]